MWRVSTVLLALWCGPVSAQPVAPRPETPAEGIALALADARTLPPAAAKQARYLDLWHVPPADRERVARVLAFQANQLSREADLTVPAVVAPGHRLLRVLLGDYRWDRRVWEQLAEQDPYHHVRVTDGRAKAAKTALAPWLADTPGQRAALAELVALTQSQVPVVSAAWWFQQTAAQQDRRPGYYDFLGVRSEKDWLALVGADLKAAGRFRVELREAVARSTVSLQPRAVARYDTLGGGYWYTLDFRAAVDRANPLRVLGRDIERRYDATEGYAHLPNGLWAMVLANRQGQLIDAAPDFIASDATAPHTDRRVMVPVSCIRCHQDGGLKDVRGWVRNLLTPPPGLALNSPDYEAARLLRQQYARRLEPFLAGDRARHQASVAAVTGGWTVPELAREYGRLWEWIVEAEVDSAWAPRDLGVTETELIRALDAQVRATGATDTVLSGFLRPRDQQHPLGIVQWWEVYPLAQSAVRGVRP